MFDLEISESALKGLDEYFSENDKSIMRIFLSPGGCSGPFLALGLDDPNDDDLVTETSGYTFCVNKDLKDAAGNLAIDSNGMGFAIVSENSFGGGGCSNCAGSCGGGGGGYTGDDD